MSATVVEEPATRREFLSPKEVSAITGTPVRTVQYYAQTGMIASTRLGKRSVRIPASEIERLRQEAEARRIGA